MTSKVPVWHVFTRALSLVWEKRGFAAAVGWPVVLLSGLWGLGADAGIVESPLAATQDQEVGRSVARNPLAHWPLFAYAGVQSFLLAIVAVFWHRNVLLKDEQVAILPFRADNFLWRYIGYALLTFLVVLVIVTAGFTIVVVVASIAAAVTGLAQLDDGAVVGATIGGLIAIPAMAVTILLMFRFGLVLPAAAVGHQGFGLKASWRATRGNSFRLLALQVLAGLFGLGIGLVEYAAIEAMSAVFGAPPHWFRLGANATVNFAYVLLGIGILSLTYAYLIHVKPQEDARME